MQTASSRVWARFAGPISKDDNRCTKGTSTSSKENGSKFAEKKLMDTLSLVALLRMQHELKENERIINVYLYS